MFRRIDRSTVLPERRLRTNFEIAGIARQATCRARRRAASGQQAEHKRVALSCQSRSRRWDPRPGATKVAESEERWRIPPEYPSAWPTRSQRRPRCWRRSQHGRPGRHFLPGPAVAPGPGLTARKTPDRGRGPPRLRGRRRQRTLLPPAVAAVRVLRGRVPGGPDRHRESCHSHVSGAASPSGRATTVAVGASIAASLAASGPTSPARGRGSWG